MWLSADDELPFGRPLAIAKVVDLLEDLLNHHSATASSRSSALTALAKVSYRLGGGLGEEGKARVDGMLEGYRSSITLELQQRSVALLTLHQCGNRGGVWLLFLVFGEPSGGRWRWWRQPQYGQGMHRFKVHTHARGCFLRDYCRMSCLAYFSDLIPDAPSRCCCCLFPCALPGMLSHHLTD